MSFQIVILAAVLAYANAGIVGAPAVATYSAAPAVSSSYFHQAAAPVAVAHAAPVAAPVVSTYAAAPVAIHAPAVGATQQSVERSLGGAQSISQYSKAVDSAFSSVRKFDTRITNDALRAAPVFSTYSAPVVAKAIAPAVASYAAPAYFHQAPGPVVSTYSAPVVTKTVAPIATYAAHAPLATYAAHAPVATYAAPAPVATYAAAPVVAKAAVSYSPATVVSHMTFSGLGTSYQW